MASDDEVFITATDMEWYENLGRSGSCLKLLDLLKRDPGLLRQMGPGNVTALHKGVRHGCVRLVKYILVDMFDIAVTGCGMYQTVECSLDLHQQAGKCLTRDDMLRQTTSDGLTAVAIAMMSGSAKMVILLHWAIKMSEREKAVGPVEEISLVGPCSESEIKTNKMKYEEFQALRKSKAHQANAVQSDPVANESDEEPGPDLSKVTDDGILPGVYKNDKDIDEVYEIIRRVLDSSDDYRDEITWLKDECEKSVDFEFTPVDHVFPHFLATFELGQNIEDPRYAVQSGIMTQIISECMKKALLKTLCNLHDPQGRTFLHVALETDRSFIGMSKLLFEETLGLMATKDLGNCVNPRDAAGRTLLHAMVQRMHPCSEPYRIHSERFKEHLNWNAVVSPLHLQGWKALTSWCFPNLPKCSERLKEDCHEAYSTPIEMAVIYNDEHAAEHIKEAHVQFLSTASNPTQKAAMRLKAKIMEEQKYLSTALNPFQIAAVLGRTKIMEDIAKNHLEQKIDKLLDAGFGNCEEEGIYLLPALHCAAMNGHVETVRSIIKRRSKSEAFYQHGYYSTYDPLVQSSKYGTALHAIVSMEDIGIKALELLKSKAFMHALPGRYAYTKKLFEKYDGYELGVKKRKYSANEQSCINLLLQAGIDIWTPHIGTKELPSPGCSADEGAIKWWYDKVCNEVVSMKMGINSATNAMSVIAALVATTSFVGPFQPPLGYDPEIGGYVHTDRPPVQIYLVCNSLSFFFSVASILMAVIPAIPLPKESMYDELLRSQRCLRVAFVMLLIAIFCMLTSFSAASVAVVPSKWHDRRLAIACISVGGFVCICVIVLYFIRMLRLLLHKSPHFRRWFAKHMIC